ncbi:MAG: hypothetical protein R3Y59_08095 [bacterium]
MKTVIKLILAAAVAGLAYVLYLQIMNPLQFIETQEAREKEVVQLMKDIRSAQRAFKSVHGVYTKSMDSLVEFVQKDSLTFEVKFGSEDDSLAKARGEVKTFKIKMAVLDTIFNPNFDATKLRYIPFSNNEEIIMDADTIRTESKVLIPVFEAKAPYKAFLADQDQQELINLIDRRKSIDKYPGIKVGSIESATNDAGNWE